ncbi:MAG: isoprenylcysteine carboxylmethyltransferase family protein [Anaerolineaceae bacterium]|nr:isoprenylcysteine carboxylmethyltransferase family protein [Anaerolineaceae bacterium]
MNNLFVRSLLGLAFLLVFLGFILFLSAGSLSFWQAWVYIAVFGISTLFVTLYLMKYDQKLLASRVAAGPSAETEKTQKVIQSLASLLFMLVFIVAGLDYRFGWSKVPSIVSVIADVFVALGFYIVFLTFKANSYTSAVIEVKQDQQVITTGPYSLVRHPMYAGASLLMIVTPLALGSWVAFPFPLLLIVTIALRAIEEEKFLAANLAGYAEYRQKVRYRIIPFVW